MRPEARTPTPKHTLMFSAGSGLLAANSKHTRHLVSHGPWTFSCTHTPLEGRCHLICLPSLTSRQTGRFPLRPCPDFCGEEPHTPHAPTQTQGRGGNLDATGLAHPGDTAARHVHPGMHVVGDGERGPMVLGFRHCQCH